MKPKKKDITILKLKHPGATDPTYRKRRAFIVRQSDSFLKKPSKIPHIRYTKKEHKTWETVLKNLEPLHRQHASRAYLEAKKKIAFPKNRIPQLREISDKLQKANNFKLEPIGGLVDVRFFLGKLGSRTMISTQYIRHHSKPEYTPEPDIVHETVGHTPMFVNKEFADFSEMLGKAALKASPRQLRKIEKLYWFTIEFGLIRERGKVKVFGAGILSSFGEMPHVFSGKPVWRPFSVAEIVRTNYSYSEMQKKLFIIPSFKILKKETRKFLKKEGL